ncbi:hypothetical protein LEP1GSC193_0602 [Leptospira alstonii serovar Pingchang str. 80-412]|uniref:Uncharacterized protein n=2 Tax=Leptospira alstonii TaxID=28452 RepID=M6CY70_9LEPT|nr:hypothetical protein LEP1GSC194_2041 [Leptospira alstonii serovar Sichuan str. 79601]EQA79985.1 hypothetical protein LEP1GSC193_0602 [Leptospira alstonii serovar Pingchang str. 80-412]
MNSGSISSANFLLPFETSSTFYEIKKPNGLFRISSSPIGFVSCLTRSGYIL